MTPILTKSDSLLVKNRFCLYFLVHLLNSKLFLCPLSLSINKKKKASKRHVRCHTFVKLLNFSNFSFGNVNDPHSHKK